MNNVLTVIELSVNSTIVNGVCTDHELLSNTLSYVTTIIERVYIGNNIRMGMAYT